MSDASAASQASQSKPNNLVQRTLSALVLLPLLLLLVWVGGIWFDLATAMCAALALHELFQMFAHSGYPPRRIGYFCLLLFLLAAAFGPRFGIDAGLALLGSVVVSLLAELPRREREVSFLRWALTLSGTAYIGWTFAYFMLLRRVSTPLAPGPLTALAITPGAAWILLALLITFASDTTAYLVGRMIGRHRMTPYISPKKTWEGAAGALVGALAIGALLVPVLGLPIPIWGGAALGVAGSAMGQAGDLVESLIKRQVGIKDSGHLIPGHGGILDRADSLLFTVPTIYYVVRWLTA